MALEETVDAISEPKSVKVSPGVEDTTISELDDGPLPEGNFIQCEDSSQSSEVQPNEAISQDTSYFDAQALATHLKARQSSALQAERDDPYPSTSLESPSSTTPSSDSRLTVGKSVGADSVNSKKAPGWKGWLRSASNTGTAPFRLDLGRKSIPPQSHIANHAEASSLMARSNETLFESFEKLRLAIGKEGEDSEAAFYSELLQSQAPREMSALSSKMRQGVPSTYRGLVWQALMTSKNTDLEEVYNELSSIKFCDHEKQIRKDVSRMGKNWEKHLKRDI